MAAAVAGRPGGAHSAGDVYAAQFARHYLPVALVAVPLRVLARGPPSPGAPHPVYAASMPHALWAQARRVPLREVLLAREDARGGYRYRRPAPRPPPLVIRVHRHRVVRDR